MARQVVWTYSARADFLEKVHAAGASLEEFPERGRIVREIPEKERREIFVQKYRLVYRLETDKVVILRLIHGKRDFKTAWKRKPK